MEYAIGFDIGGTRTKTGLVNLSDGTITDPDIFPTPKNEKDFLNMIKRSAEKYIENYHVSGIGAAASGFVRNGCMDYSDGSFIPFFSGYPLEERISDTIGLPCCVMNDAAAAAFGEALAGAGKGFRRILCLTLGTGIGVGAVFDGNPNPDNSLIHMAGHIRVRCRTYSDNKKESLLSTSIRSITERRPCYCGIEGCFESICSGTGLSRTASEVYGENVSPQELFRRYSIGDSVSEEIIEYYLGCLSDALNQYIYLYAPDCIVMGGGLSESLVPLLPDLSSRLIAKVWSGYSVSLHMSTLRENAGLVGAAMMAERGKLVYNMS